MSHARVTSLFDVDDVTTFGPVANMTVEPVTTAEVAEFTRRWHYSGGPGSALWRYGLIDRGESEHGMSDQVVVGVVAYNIPTLRTCASLFGPEYAQTVVHMGRLVCADHAPRNSESRLIAQSLKQLSQHKPELRAVVTFAAQDEGHIGYVYQATNAIYTGTGGYPKNYVTADGIAISTNGKCGADDVQRLSDRGVSITSALPKHRYVYLLGDRRQRRESMRLLRLPQLPYPKDLATTSRRGEPHLARQQLGEEK